MNIETIQAPRGAIAVLSGGKVVGEGSPEALGRTSSPWVRQFLQGLPDGPVPFHYPAPDFLGDLLGGGSP